MRKSEEIFYDTVIKMTSIIESLCHEVNKKESEIEQLKNAILELNNYIEKLENRD